MIHRLVVALSLASAALSASPALHTVIVGAGGRPVYSPNNTQAIKGDIVRMQFSAIPGNHTVSQAAFAAPCAQMEEGFDSGFVVASNVTQILEVNFTVQNEHPIYFYCKQATHCIEGMVGSINAPSEGNQTLAAFAAAAKALPAMPSQSPGAGNPVDVIQTKPGPIYNGTSPSNGNATSTSTAAPTATSTGNAAFKATSASLWTLLASVLGIVIA